jgi:phosphomannomutase
MTNLSELVKAYEVRGVVPDQLNDEVARALGAAFIDVTGSTRLVLAHDMRDSGPAPGISVRCWRRSWRSVHRPRRAGLDRSALLRLGFAGPRRAMFTASHNPAQYNGIKLCRAGAVPIGSDTGLVEIRDRAAVYLRDGCPTAEPQIDHLNMLGDYARHLRSLVDLPGIRQLTLVVDAGNGMGGHTVPAVLADVLLDPLPLTIVPLYFELDGTFPNHEANPLEPANQHPDQATWAPGQRPPAAPAGVREFEELIRETASLARQERRAHR